jgi:hypothetical protein
MKKLIEFLKSWVTKDFVQTMIIEAFKAFIKYIVSKNT